ncbi:ergothioneine biosynthesis protein EgtB [Allomuricauda sp. SCSIO 65647]|uniref:ergothioneine biosynthesis protein EgtB n=1 Tax=Allomuricauda sp. SCSIO 65647 TaxID=2908843 RepID=UPI001F4271B3|nr:ergothioneine biosynthesis protein EgtB [Muricauda sp. SCSIO 65647]UJH68279.1 ergothioneine biosynthesis protein EgtB [Muricauda sp. SCSIO 65647]
MIVTDSLLDFFLKTRKHTEKICKPLENEDYVVQPVVDVSPPKWHLGHTTWFFEEFILKPYAKDYNVFHDDFSFVFNSYYETVGKRVVRANRGNLSRPSVKKVYEYRDYVTKGIKNLFQIEQSPELYDLLEIGIHHEKQHQELLLTDIKYILGNNPLLPKYSDDFEDHPIEKHEREWIAMDEGVFEVGHNEKEFCYDNELGRHKVYLQPYQIANKLVTNQEYIEFLKDGGYQRFDLWHAEGWDWVNANNINSPLYWHKIGAEWYHYTAKGLQRVSLNAPITHISYYEAFAYAQWKGLRLPTEFEWEAAQQFFPWGKRWEWTESAYLPYPNYRKAEGALGEYNGKFMANQKVLRGGSVATPEKHTRPTYRNFFHPHLRWQFTGLRLAQ